MSIKKCKRCQNDMDAKASLCPFCRSDQRSWFIRHPFISIILALFVLAVVSSFGKSPNQNNSQTKIENNVVKKNPPQPSEVIRINAIDLFSHYEENSIKADSDYKGKELEVAGVTSSISKDIADSMYVTLKTDNLIGNIQCMLKDSEREKAMDLSPGESITVKGKNNGKMINVILKDCVIVTM